MASSDDEVAFAGAWARATGVEGCGHLPSLLELLPGDGAALHLTVGAGEAGVAEAAGDRLRRTV